MNIAGHVSSWISFCLFLYIFPDVEFLDHMQFYFEFVKKPPYCFPWWKFHQFTFLPTVYKGSLFSISLPHLLLVIFLRIAILIGMRCYLWFWFAFASIFWWLVMLGNFSFACWSSVFPQRTVYSILLPIFESGGLIFFFNVALY